MPIVVVGIHCGGTSAVAGVLHYLGVNMGENLGETPLGASPNNPKGQFEDWDFVNLHDEIIGFWKNPKPDFEPHREAYTNLVQSKSGHWGVKDPRMCFMFPYFLEVCTEKISVIFVDRHWGSIAGSLYNRGESKGDAHDITARYVAAQGNALNIALANPYKARTMLVSYEDLVSDPETYVDRIAYFIGEPTSRKAIEFIDPSLCHWREGVEVGD